MLTAVVMEQNTVHRPRIQIEVSHANTTRELLVHVDAQIYHFDNKETRVRYFGLRGKTSSVHRFLYEIENVIAWHVFYPFLLSVSYPKGLFYLLEIIVLYH